MTEMEMRLWAPVTNLFRMFYRLIDYRAAPGVDFADTKFLSVNFL